MFQIRASIYFAFLIVPYRLVFHRWGHQCLLCKGWLSGQPPVPAPGRHRILSRWALLVTIAGCCWWRLTCPPSPSKTRWSSSAQPTEITSAGGEGKEKNGLHALWLTLLTYMFVPNYIIHSEVIAIWEINSTEKHSVFTIVSREVQRNDRGNARHNCFS